jgi:hypothetical protein
VVAAAVLVAVVGEAVPVAAEEGAVPVAAAEEGAAPVAAVVQVVEAEARGDESPGG